MTGDFGASPFLLGRICGLLLATLCIAAGLQAHAKGPAEGTDWLGDA